MTTKPLPDLPDLMAKPRNGIGLVALVLAVMAVMAAGTVVGVPLAILLGLAAVVCGVKGRGKARRGETDDGISALVGLVVGAATAAVCFGLVVWVVHGLNEAFREDQSQPDDLVSAGGRYEAPLGPGETARYRNGLKMSLSAPHRIPNVPGDLFLEKGDLTYVYTVTYVNDQKGAVDLVWNGIKCDEKITPGGLASRGPMSPDWDKTHTWFPDRLEPHQTVSVQIPINVPPGSTTAELTCRPMAYGDDAHWLLPLHP
ncbi:hypothetical protein CTZ27_29865 [Streptomyces griseocarneus]|nr:hypothetical protein CTZ27_29865 [Streptomyces griseocarneus]